jgi:hypothetical protein
MKLTDHTSLPDARRVSLSEALAPLRTLGDVVSWGLAQGCDIAEVVTQDEYTHDVVLPWREGLTLVFDTT